VIEHVNLAIGDIGIVLVPHTDDAEFEFDERLAPFVSSARPDITLRVDCGPIPRLQTSALLFETGQTWALYRAQERLVYVLRLAGDAGLDRVAELEPDLRYGTIYLGPPKSGRDRCVFPLVYPLGELLVAHYLSLYGGLLVHACAVSDRGRGLLFAGTSGAGKSTISRLWRGAEGVHQLSDDRVILREKDGRFWVYGTPWHGDAKVASPEATLLERVYILQHGIRNQATCLKPRDAISRLLVRSFPTYWDPAGMARTLAFLAELTQSVPCYDLAFLPNQGAVDYVRCTR